MHCRKANAGFVGLFSDISFDFVSIEAVLFQGAIHKEIGTDLSVGLKYRPFLNQNMVIVGGVAGFLPGQGFKDIYEKQKTLYHVFTNVILTF